jgi:hypothetical protein
MDGDMSTISAGNTTTTAITVTGDTTGNLVFQTQAGTNTITVPNITGTMLTNKTAGTVLQVVQIVKSDTFSTNSASFTDITGLSVSITPTSTDSKILVLSTTAIGGNAADQVTLRLVRSSTTIFAGDAAGNRSLGFYGLDTNAIGLTAVLPQTIVYLDSPATASAVTYKIQGKTGSTFWYVNRSSSDDNEVYRTRTASSIIVMEIAG